MPSWISNSPRLQLPKTPRFLVIRKLLKLAFICTILAWMLQSGKLDLKQVLRAFVHWPELLLILLIGYVQAAVLAWRWKLLLDVQKIRISGYSAFRLTMIGLLFNLVIPSSVGGDVMKGYYLSRDAQAGKTDVYVTILMDRIVGLLGLFILAAGNVAFSWPSLSHQRTLIVLAWTSVGGAVGGCLLLAALITLGGRIAAIARLPEIVRQSALAVFKYRHSPRVVFGSLAITVAAHSMVCVMFYLAMHAIGLLDFPVGSFLLLVPFGLITTALPIAPGGIGVGQAAFFALFASFSAPLGQSGANAFTLFQVVQVLIALSGLVYYLRVGADPLRRDVNGI